jgi:hypothetical protein
LTGAFYPASPGLFISTIKLKEAFMMPEWLREQVDRTYDCNDNWLGAHSDKSRYREEERGLGYFRPREAESLSPIASGKQRPVSVLEVPDNSLVREEAKLNGSGCGRMAPFVLGRDLFEREMGNVRSISGMFNCHRADIAVFIQVELGVFIQISGLSHFCRSELDVERVGVLKVYDGHGLKLLSKKALWTVRRSARRTTRKYR